MRTPPEVETITPPEEPEASQLGQLLGKKIPNRAQAHAGRKFTTVNVKKIRPKDNGQQIKEEPSIVVKNVSGVPRRARMSVMVGGSAAGQGGARGLLALLKVAEAGAQAENVDLTLVKSGKRGSLSSMEKEESGPQRPARNQSKIYTTNLIVKTKKRKDANVKNKKSRWGPFELEDLHSRSLDTSHELSESAQAAEAQLEEAISALRKRKEVEGIIRRHRESLIQNKR